MRDAKASWIECSQGCTLLFYNPGYLQHGLAQLQASKQKVTEVNFFVSVKYALRHALFTSVDEITIASVKIVRAMPAIVWLTVGIAILPCKVTMSPST